MLLITNANSLYIPFADETVQCVVTSPPYYGLRDYGTAEWVGGAADCDHKVRPTHNVATSTLGGGKKTAGHWQEGHKQECTKCGAVRVDNQLGLESSPDCLGWATKQPCGHCYVCHMVQVFREVWRVLRPDGCVWLNLGDTYCGTGDKKDYRDPKYKEGRNGQSVAVNRVVSGLKSKDVLGIPWRVAFALQADGWYLRSDVIWAKPNSLPESVTDRPTKAHEYVFLLAKSKDYYFDHIAIQEPQAQDSLARLRRGVSATHKNAEGAPGQTPHSLAKPRPNRSGGAFSRSYADAQPNHGGENWERPEETGMRNKRSVWHIPTQSYRGAHFATFPEKLVEPMILAGTSAKGACEHCGAPWERVIERAFTDHTGETESEYADGTTANRMSKLRQAAREQGVEYSQHTKTIGWRPTCKCANNTGSKPCLVLDPFAGTATTGKVAAQHGRAFVGLELNPKYITLARGRTSNLQPTLAEMF